MAAVAACGLALAVVAGCGSAGPAGAPPSNAPAAGTQPAGLSLDSFPPMPAGPAPGASAQVRELARALNGGINFGNMLEPPKEGDWGLTVTQEFIDLIGQPGFTNAVRLPVRWSNHASADAAALIDEKFFQRVDAVLAALLAKGATVVLDMHHYRQFDGDALDPGEAPVADAVVDVRLLSMWKQIAQRYANHSPRLIFEIYNEPHGRSEPRWNDMLSRALRVIRQSNPERAVVIGPTLWNSATRLNQLVLPPDPNLIITVHHYEPFDFTHQGAEWITPPKPTGVDCCNAAQTQQIQELLDAAAQMTLSEEATNKMTDEMEKLSILETSSAEYNVTRNYVDWLTALPWGIYSKDKLNIKRARKILDDDHDELKDVKERILEFLAVGKLKGKIGGSIILLIGPPGVGKTSIGRSVARAIGREFFRFSVGGMRDEAEIKGHRRTYVGAMPGKVIQALRYTKVANPIFMLDEVDKIGASYHGDPASALLEVLDPEQNTEFLDHYLDVRFNLSKVLFLCTANQTDTIPSALLDRMEIIRLSGYITSEKLVIARNHLIPKQLEKNGLSKGKLRFSTKAVRTIIDGYAREAGVRHLEQKIAAVSRKAALKILEHTAKTPINIKHNAVEKFLGKPNFRDEQPISGVGIVTGLAWTAMGGATLDIESARVRTIKSDFILTGNMGDVMKESARIAFSFIQGTCKTLGGKAKILAEGSIHIHVPEGATPKDGPSAGITMATSLLSLARNEPVSRRLAMTGEITLTGHILPVGGIREKVIAARRVGIREIILPNACRKDYEEVPEHIREGFIAHFVKRYEEVAKLVFAQNRQTSE